MGKGKNACVELTCVSQRRKSCPGHGRRMILLRLRQGGRGNQRGSRGKSKPIKSSRGGMACPQRQGDGRRAPGGKIERIKPKKPPSPEPQSCKSGEVVTDRRTRPFRCACKSSTGKSQGKPEQNLEAAGKKAHKTGLGVGGKNNRNGAILNRTPMSPSWGYATPQKPDEAISAAAEMGMGG